MPKMPSIRRKQRRTFIPSPGRAATVALTAAALSSSPGTIPLVNAESCSLNGNPSTTLATATTTRTNVDDYASLALDLREITVLLADDQFNDARNLYERGKNSPRFDSQCQRLPDDRSLQSLSTAAQDGAYDSDPTFLFHQYGLASLDESRLREYALYADQTVLEFLDDDSSGKVAAEAMLALNVWTAASHQLWAALESCRKIERGINAGAAGVEDDLRGLRQLDRFVALYIGSDQKSGSTDGHGIYALAQSAAESFGTTPFGGGEALANAAVRTLYEDAAGLLATSGACNPASSTRKSLYASVQQILSQMTVPLVQKLVEAMSTNDALRVKLYGRALVPQLSQCRRSTFRRIKESVLDRAWDTSRFGEALKDLESAYECLGVSCDLIGTYNNGAVPMCEDDPGVRPLAGYVPTSPVLSLAKIDLDVYQMKALMRMEKWDAALDLYSFGKNSILETTDASDPKEMRSLRALARSSLRKKAVTYFAYYSDYHQDANYADAMVTQGLTGSGKFVDEFKNSPVERYEYVSNVVQYQITYMYALAEMFDALTDCREGDPTDNKDDASVEDQGVHSWDQVASLYVGSLEGPDQGGSPDQEDGQLVWNLANAMAFEFGTDNSDGYAKANEDALELLYAGKGELDAYACDNLRNTVRGLEKLHLVPIVQGILSHARKNAGKTRGTVAATDDPDAAAGEALALAFLPLAAELDPDGAERIEEYMTVKTGGVLAEDGAQAVAEAMQGTMKAMGIPCQLVGKVPGVNICRGYSLEVEGEEEENDAKDGGGGGGGGLSSGGKAAIAIIVIGAVLGGAAFYVRRRSRGKEEIGLMESQDEEYIEGEEIVDGAGTGEEEKDVSPFRDYGEDNGAAGIADDPEAAPGMNGVDAEEDVKVHDAVHV